MKNFRRKSINPQNNVDRIECKCQRICNYILDKPVVVQ